LIARTPNTFLVGAGPVATALAGALRLGGVPVLGLWARDPASARSAGAVAGVASFSAAPPDLLLEADVVILAVRDDAISEVAAKLCATGLITRHHVMIHCSGVMPAEVAFADVRERLGGVATLHPLRAIPDGRAAMRNLGGTVFGVEGDERGRREALALVKALGGRPLELSAEQMAAYHAAAAIASNYLVALLDVAAAVMRGAGVGRDEAVAALIPLTSGTLDNVRERGLEGALTGPILRADRDTVARHLAVLDRLPGEVGALYRELGRRTLEIARRQGDRAAAEYDAIEALLGGSRETGMRSATSGKRSS
jgi:predicted short-subunit dehydrogenase-like oxidoreductase (DUF2520 family)